MACFVLFAQCNNKECNHRKTSCTLWNNTVFLGTRKLIKFKCRPLVRLEFILTDNPLFWFYALFLFGQKKRCSLHMPAEKSKSGLFIESLDSKYTIFSRYKEHSIVLRILINFLAVKPNFFFCWSLQLHAHTCKSGVARPDVGSGCWKTRKTPIIPMSGRNLVLLMLGYYY